jgi:hypothetical protein
LSPPAQRAAAAVAAGRWDELAVASSPVARTAVVALLVPPVTGRYHAACRRFEEPVGRSISSLDQLLLMLSQSRHHCMWRRGESRIGLLGPIVLLLLRAGKLRPRIMRLQRRELRRGRGKRLRRVSTGSSGCETTIPWHGRRGANVKARTAREV